MSPRTTHDRPFRPLAFGLALLGLTGLAIADDTPKPGLTDAERAKQVESFEVVWKTIRDTHFDPTLGGLDWPAIHDEFLPKVEKAADRAEARAAMTEMLGRLRQTHFGIIPSGAYKALEDGQAAGSGETGLPIRIIEGRPVVLAVPEGSAAAKVGVKPGWIVAKVRNKDMADVLAAVTKAYASTPEMIPGLQARAVQSRLGGPIGETVDVEFLDGDDRPVALDVPLAKPTGTEARFGHLPPFHVRFESKRLADDIGYVALSVFFDPVNVLKQFADAVAAHRDTQGLVIDLRGNPGGIGAMALGIGGWFVNGPNQKLGTMITRDGQMLFALNPRPEPFGKPVAILVDELSMSTSEILAGGLQDLGRARIFGTKTPGAALPSRVDVLPNGDRFQYAFANYVSTGGKPLEGTGVVPDVPVAQTRAALLEGRDAALEAARAWIHNRP